MPTHTTNNRLLIIRDSINEAKQLITDRSQDFDRMKALWLADLAVDMMLSTVISYLGLSLKSGNAKRPMFEDLEKTVFEDSTPTLSGLKTHRSLANTVHNQRNGVQHQGISPSLTTARDCVYGAENFLRDAFKNVFNVELETFSLSDFITFEKAKEYLKEAEKHFAEGNYTECSWIAAQAFEQGKDDFYRMVRGDGENSWKRPYSWSHDMKEKGKHNPIGTHSSYQKENEAITEIAEVLEISRYGLDIHRVLLFFQTAPRTEQNLGRTMWMRFGEPKDFSIEEAKFILAFSTEALYRMQSFTSNYWLPQ
jgi:hypothetical protein